MYMDFRNITLRRQFDVSVTHYMPTYIYKINSKISSLTRMLHDRTLTDLGDRVEDLSLLLLRQLSGVLIQHHVLEAGLGELGPVVGHLLTHAARLALRLPAEHMAMQT